MRLSEAIIFGSSLRPESHQERFCNVENRGLCSDAWGAACEAVQPAVAKLNWNPKDRQKFETAMEVVRAVQQTVFGAYFRMPARCPGAHQPYVEAGARIINGRGQTKETEGRQGDLGGVTTECDMVEHLAGMVDHLFYAHGWSRAQVAEVVQWYEETRTLSLVAQTFHHYQDPTSATRMQHKLTQQSLEFLRRRKAKRGY